MKRFGDMFGDKEKKEKQERKLTGLVFGLIQSNLKGLARGIVKVVRLQWRNKPIPVDQEPKAAPDLPEGPYQTSRNKERGDLLLFVPRRLNSFIIDDLSGGYGYSHAAIDCGEVDLPTGRPVMIESTVGRPVERAYLDTYGQRKYVRVRLSKAGVNPEQFCECIKSKLGQPYDNVEALTWGQIDDPAKQVCSNLVTICLPEEICQDMARSSRLRLLRRRSVSVLSHTLEHGLHMFISPNGFAEYFGAPQGEDIKAPGQVVIPNVVTSSPVHAAAHVVHQSDWKIGLAVVAVAVIGIIATRSWWK